jgi:hypothetical protein
MTRERDSETKRGGGVASRTGAGRPTPFVDARPLAPSPAEVEVELARYRWAVEWGLTRVDLSDYSDDFAEGWDAALKSFREALGVRHPTPPKETPTDD